jgi:hypothetical protein
VAVDNYSRVASKFDGVAGKFSTAASLVDPETPAADVVGESDKVRQAWSSSERHAAELTTVLPALVAAAGLAGAEGVNGSGALFLCCDPGTRHRRRVWEAWRHSDGRCGRWAALHRLGVKLRACELGDFKPYAPPRPLETELRAIPGGGHVEQTVDPEDAQAAG